MGLPRVRGWFSGLLLAIALSGCGPSEAELAQLSQLRQEIDALSQTKDQIQSSAWYLLGEVRAALEAGSIARADSLVEVLQRLHPKTDEAEQASALRRMYR